MRVVAFVVLVVSVAALFVVWRRWYAWRVATERLTDMMGQGVQEATRHETHVRAERTFPPRYHVLAPVVGAVAAGLARVAFGVPLTLTVSIAALVGVLTHLVEEYIADERQAKIEAQLSAAIDLLVGSLRAGSSLLAAFESALQEAEAPLRPYLQEVAGRIRLGDDPRQAVSDLQVRVPLETFRLFSASLAIHWEVGGSLATTLTTVGRTVRDRIELSRRVRAQGVESHASVAVVMIMAYVLGFLMWRTNPDRLEGFVQTGAGTLIVAVAVGLQAVGLIWMSRLSRSQF